MTEFGTTCRVYVLLALLLAYTLSYMDRIVIAVLLPQIKAEMQLADWQLGLLTGAAFGALAGGLFADLTARHDRRWQLRLPGTAMLVLLPVCMLAYLSDSLVLVYGGIFAMQIASMIYMGPVYANTQMLVGLRMRAVAAAFTLLLVSVIGLGIGPLAIGALSDLLQARSGTDSLRYALCALLLFQGGTGVMLLRDAGTLETDLARTPEAGARPAGS